MPPAKPKNRRALDPDPFLALMGRWPDSWAGSELDIPVGESLVAEMKPFIVHLCSLGLARSTIRDHLDHCWVIGGEIIRSVVMESRFRRRPPRILILDAIAFGAAPLVEGASDEEQRGFDATARKLLKFLNPNA